MEKLRRIVAMISVVVIVALIIGMVICAIMGSKYFFGMLALVFLIPITLWVFMWFTKLVNPSSDSEPGETTQE